MQNADTTVVTVETSIEAPLGKVWECFTQPEHIVHWNHASDDWHTTKAENDLREGGRFNWRMEAKDGSYGFDFTGTYNAVENKKYIEYVLDDNRVVKIHFSHQDDLTKVLEHFDSETTHPVDVQLNGWQAILTNFKKYVERTD